MNFFLRHKKHAPLAALIGFITTLLIWGPIAHEAVVSENLQGDEHLVSLRIPIQPVSVLLDQEPEKFPFYRGGKYHSNVIVGYTWSVLLTSDWAVFNGSYAKYNCPAILEGLAEFNSVTQHQTLEDVQELMAKNKGTPVTLWVHVPRFTAEPASLSSCKDFGYDTATQFVTYKGKPIALASEGWTRNPSLRTRAPSQP